MIVGTGLALVLLALSALHLYWGVGGLWPGQDARSLNERVVGIRRNTAPGFVACAAVATALACAAFIVIARQGRIEHGLKAFFVYGGYAVMIGVFGLRGLAPYVTRVFDYARGTPFFDLNRRYYSPLCLSVAIALLWSYPPGLQNIFQV